mmetsp:Transcript_49730/g.90033  ORF Transcript_49730/g.90033 Transcript_49730/m.90033 type:complete len:203 (-) Transcript_49730:1243-1851(-)
MMPKMKASLLPSTAQGRVHSLSSKRALLVSLPLRAKASEAQGAATWWRTSSLSMQDLGVQNPRMKECSLSSCTVSAANQKRWPSAQQRRGLPRWTSPCVGSTKIWLESSKKGLACQKSAHPFCSVAGTGSTGIARSSRRSSPAVGTMSDVVAAAASSASSAASASASSRLALAATATEATAASLGESDEPLAMAPGVASTFL